MSALQKIVDRLVVSPVAKRMISSLNGKEMQTPSVYAVPFQYNYTNADNARSQSGAVVTFSTLRQMSLNHETSRAAINLRKRQISQLEWDIADEFPGRSQKYSDDALFNIKQTFRNIGGANIRFREILDKVIEDILVLDACVLYKQKTVGGKLLRIIPIDGATIKLKVDEAGLVPLAPDIGFEQWIRGEKVAEMTTSELTYERMNPRTTSPYGLSPLEGLIISVDSSLRAALYNANYLSDNNIPAGFLEMPENWTVQQIQDFKQWFDSMVSNPREQNKIYPTPAGSKYTPISKPNDFAFKDFNDYLDRKTAMLFDVTPQELGLSLQQYKENAEIQQDIQIRKGLKPLAYFIEDILTDILKYDMGLTDLVFKFNGIEHKYTTEEARTLVPLGIISVDEVRADRGDPKIGVDNYVITGAGVTLVSDIVNGTAASSQQASTVETPAEGAQATTAKDEKQDDIKPNAKGELALDVWERKALNDMKSKGRVYRKFEDESLLKHERVFVERALAKADSVDGVKEIFNKARKLKQNPHDILEKTAKFKQFITDVYKALLEQIKPFTNPQNIEELVKMEKADTDVGGLLVSFDLPGLDDYLDWAATSGYERNVKAPFQMQSGRFRKFIGDRTNYLIDSVDDTTKDWLISEIENGKLEMLTNEEIASKISRDFDNIGQARAQVIVRTEVANAALTGELASYKDQGIEEKMWVTSEDEMVCEICEPMDGEVVGIDEVFSDGSDVPQGHPNCRCYMTAVFR